MNRILPALLLFACGEPQNLLPDSGSPIDAAPEDTGGMDAAPDDRGSRDAAPIDGSLAGTSLEGIALEWSQELRLCEEWLNGDDVEAAAAQKVQVTLPPHSRTTLEPEALGAAMLAGGSVHRSPFSTDRFEIAGSSSTLIEWTLTPPADQAHLSATIAHELGSAGTLFELISVRRQGGDRSPVAYGTFEAAFAYQPPGGERFFLRACEAGPPLENAVVVLSAFDGDGWVTLMREQKMQTVVAGSGAVYPERAEALFSWQGPWSGAFLADGHWTQTYTAGLHNWNEHALVRFDRDLLWYYLVFGPLSRGEMPSYPPTIPQAIELAGINSPGSPGSLTATYVELPGGTLSEQTFAVNDAWRRVDETELSRAMVGCADPEVTALWGVTAAGAHLFQLGFCQAGSPITELALFVPIFFKPDPHLAGMRFDAISQVDVSGFPGVEIALGEYFVQIAEPGVFRTVMLDASRNLIEETNSYRTELFEENAFAPETIEAKSADGAVTIELVRQWVAQGAGNSSIFAPVSFRLVLSGRAHRVTAWDKLTYTNTHHNWDDTLETDDGELRMFWRVLEFGQAYEVRAERISDGTEALPPTIVRR